MLRRVSSLPLYPPSHCHPGVQITSRESASVAVCRKFGAQWTYLRSGRFHRTPEASTSRYSRKLRPPSVFRKHAATRRTAHGQRRYSGFPDPSTSRRSRLKTRSLCRKVSLAASPSPPATALHTPPLHAGHLLKVQTRPTPRPRITPRTFLTTTFSIAAHERTGLANHKLTRIEVRTAEYRGKAGRRESASVLQTERCGREEQGAGTALRDLSGVGAPRRV
ncbi:hypothetical protein B0H11DRAFT_2043205 [Mycena galericulata]|nr:hypothetical protein B0H11DRAFT_2043205 [Mycena galericulata]